MVKISLNGEYADVFANIPTFIFVEELGEFERMLRTRRRNEQYQDARAMQPLADFYSDTGISEDEDAAILEEAEIEFNDHSLTLHDFFESEICSPFERAHTVNIYAQKISLKFACIKFRNRFYLAAKYRLEGMCQKGYGEWLSIPWHWINNPVIYGDNPSESRGWRTDGWDVVLKDAYSQDWIETFAWLQISEADCAEDILLDKSYIQSVQVIDQLLSDIYEALR